MVGPRSSGLVNGERIEPSAPVTINGVRVRASGATIVTHGYQFFDGDGDSLHDLARDIWSRADSENGPRRDAWLLDYDIPTFLGFVVGDERLDTSPLDLNGSFLPTTTQHDRIGEMVILFDWAAESNELSSGWGEAAGDALFSLLVDLAIVNPAAAQYNIPLHFIGHSFGTAVTSEVVERLARFAVPVDHVTYLDPHDFNEDMPFLDLGSGDADRVQRLFTLGAPPGYGASVWANVTFADAYYQTESSPEGRPIPGAYNRLVNDRVDGTSAHTDVWNDFYRRTIQDTASTTGYGYSRIANWGLAPDALSPLRPAPIFYDLPTPNHEHSESALVNADGTPNQAGLSALGLSITQVTNGRWAPTWDPASIVNGNFEHAGTLFADIPGWGYHGGAGGGHVEFDQGTHFLELDLGDSSRVHNRLYVPPDAVALEFRFWRTDTSADDVLSVRLGATTLGTLAMDEADGGFRRAVAPLSASARNRSTTLTFEIVAHDFFRIVDSEIRIDDVRFVRAV